MLKIVFTLIVTALAAITAFAQEATRKPASAALQKALDDYIGPCPSPVKSFEMPFPKALPRGFSATMLQVESDNPYCGGMYAVLTARSNDYWVGSPWLLERDGSTPEERIKKFAWERMQIVFDAKIDKTRVVNGLYPVALAQKTESGNISIDGFIDPEGTMFLLGHFLSQAKPVGAQRLARLEKILASSPAKGPANAAVSIVEFSDFQCPSCKRAVPMTKALLEKYGDRVRYTRVDLPLVTMHPWAFAASVMGRAIYRQSPEAFWAYKDAVYESQDSLNAFTIGDFARNFAAARELDLKKLEADIESTEIQNEILASAGAGYSIPVVSTPTFLVNGEIVSLGENGKGLETAVEKALAR